MNMSFFFPHKFTTLKVSETVKGFSRGFVSLISEILSFFLGMLPSSALKLRHIYVSLNDTGSLNVPVLNSTWQKLLPKKCWKS